MHATPRLVYIAHCIFSSIALNPEQTRADQTSLQQLLPSLYACPLCRLVNQSRYSGCDTSSSSLGPHHRSKKLVSFLRLTKQCVRVGVRIVYS